jgi:vacuolar-type H+-ATPase subunit H
MSIFTRTTDDTPGNLAAEMDDARQQFEEKRSNIIERGCRRVAQINSLMAELEVERDAINEVVVVAR